MTKLILTISVLATLLFPSKANAQIDTTYFDLGRMQLKKDFTQNVTVKGEELEKMPFDNLAEAINVWFYGSYTNSASVVYIIDGNLVSDVNAYSVYDIDEVTLVQNALSQLNGTSQNQQIVVIKTKRPKRKGYGVTANGQAYVNSLYTNNVYNAQSGTYETGLKSTSTIYQQYNVSAYKSTDNLQFGVSADYLKNALPVIEQSGTAYNTPENLDRLRFNGYFDAKIGRSLLDVTAGYAPQKQALENSLTYSDNDFTNNNFGQTGSLFNSSVKLTTRIVPGLTNVLHGDYNNDRADEHDMIVSGGPTYGEVTNSNYSHYDRTLVAYDNLSYTAKFGNWGLEPSANISFRTLKDSTGSNTVSVEQNNGQSGSTLSFWFHKHVLEFTPALNLYYKSYFNLEEGFIYNTVNIGGYKEKPEKLFPFVSASADVMKLVDPEASLSVKFYGSYSQSYLLADNANSLEDFTGKTIQEPVFNDPNYPVTPYNGYGYFNLTGTGNYAYNLEVFDPQVYNEVFKTLSAGISIAPLKSGLVFSYFFEKRNYLSTAYIYVPEYANSISIGFTYINTNSILHRLGLDYTLVNSSSFNWHMGINATMQEQKYLLGYGTPPSTGGSEWTGGWVNRLSYRSFFAGIDVLYFIGEKTYVPGPLLYEPYIVNKTNAFSLQNLYAGYRIKAAGLKNLEVFANGRNLLQNKKGDITDNSKYYGLGFRLSL